MAKMRDMDVRAKSVEKAIEAFKNGDFLDKMENAGAKTFAYPTYLDVEGTGELKEVWVTAEFTCKMWKPYNVKGIMHEAYDPFEVQRDYEFDKATKEAKAKETAERKKKKVEKDKKLREQLKAKKNAEG